ncbi:MAG: hypothetical protein ACI9K2_004173, partial [Myxococcota bacterium]
LAAAAAAAAAARAISTAAAGSAAAAAAAAGAISAAAAAWPITAATARRAAAAVTATIAAGATPTSVDLRSTAVVASRRSSAARSTRSTRSAWTASLFCLIDTNGPSVEHRVVHLLDGDTRVSVFLERHKPESTTAAGVAIKDHPRFADLTKRLKGSPKSLVRSVPAQPAHEKLATHAPFMPDRFRLHVCIARRA